MDGLRCQANRRGLLWRGQGVTGFWGMEPQAEMELKRGVSRDQRATSSGKDGGACVCAC